MPLLRVNSPPERTDSIVDVISSDPSVRHVSVIPLASRKSVGDLILADIPRASVERILHRLQSEHPQGVHIAVDSTAPLHPQDDDIAEVDDAMVWERVSRDLLDLGRLSWPNTLLVLIAAAIAAVGIIEDQLLLIVGAMALSPDYYPIANTSLAFTVGDRRRARTGMFTITVLFGAAAVGAASLTEILVRAGLDSADVVPAQHLTLFISEPGWLSVVVAALAGVAGAVSLTLPHARGLVGVFVSITTIPAAANIGVAFVAREWAEIGGAAVQLVANVLSLLVAGIVTLRVRRPLRPRD